MREAFAQKGLASLIKKRAPGGAATPVCLRIGHKCTTGTREILWHADCIVMESTFHVAEAHLVLPVSRWGICAWILPFVITHPAGLKKWSLDSSHFQYSFQGDDAMFQIKSIATMCALVTTVCLSSSTWAGDVEFEQVGDSKDARIAQLEAELAARCVCALDAAG